MKKLVALLLLAAVSASLFTFDAAASESTAYTFTQSVNKEWIRTQDAYMPSGALLNGGELSSPNDLFIYGQKLYIADTEKINEEETGRVLIYDTVSGDISVIGSGFLKNPTGVFVNDEYVPIDYILQNKDRIRIVTDDLSYGPRDDWMEKTHTSYAKQKIRDFNRK